MNSKVAILTAGIGSRLDKRTKCFNKSLLRVGDKAVISHQIELFDKSTEIVVALGYKGCIVRQYLEISHPDRKFTFVDVDKFLGFGSGPGYSMLQCEKYLHCPFYFFSCDSLFKKVDATQFWAPYWSQDNWIAYDYIKKEDCEKYCTIDDSKKEIKYFDKDKEGTNKAFIGIAHIKDYKIFWDKLKGQKETKNKEIQIAPVLCEMPSLDTLHLKWYDTGDEEGLRRAKKHFKGIQNLDKLDEELYVVDDSVVKYFHNENIVRNRLERAKVLGSTIPFIVSKSKNYYKYRFCDGLDLFKVDHSKVMKDLLDYTQESLWSKKQSLSKDESIVFHDVCKKFYYDKTLARIKKLKTEKNIKDKPESINGLKTPKLEHILNNLCNWSFLSQGIPANFHGDYNLSNILYNKEDHSFKFLDWRQDFGGIIQYGDIYYDFAKMYHSFLFPHPIVKKGRFYINKQGINEVKTFIEIPIEIERSKDIFEQFIIDNGYDLVKAKLLTAIVLLNMSPLHESPMDEFLYYFGKYFLFKNLRGQYE